MWPQHPEVRLGVPGHGMAEPKPQAVVHVFSPVIGHGARIGVGDFRGRPRPLSTLAQVPRVALDQLVPVPIQAGQQGEAAGAPPGETEVPGRWTSAWLTVPLAGRYLPGTRPCNHEFEPIEEPTMTPTRAIRSFVLIATTLTVL